MWTLLLALTLGPGSVGESQVDRPEPGFASTLPGEAREPGTTPFSLHDLNYALLGADDGRMQLSFKYQVFEETPVYLAYTNIVLWDVFADSGPYRDIEFLPELFYRFDRRIEGVEHLDLGWIHRSNGQDGLDSRSWDRLFARADLDRSFAGRPARLSPRLQLPIATGGENEDIADYHGFWEVDLWVHRLLDPEERGLSLHLRLVSGEDGVPFDRGSFTAGLAYDFGVRRFQPKLYAEYFKGYGNSLLEYDQSEELLRFGLLL